MTEATSPAGGTRGPARWVVHFFWVLPLGLYVATAGPGPGWVDSSMIASHVHDMRTGIWVNIHNLFNVVGRAWLLFAPAADPHHALNLLCAVLGAATVYLIFLTGLQITRNVAAAALGGTALMLSHSLWWHSTMLEVYTLNTALLALMLLLIVRYSQSHSTAWLYAAVFCFGLACANHAQMALLIFAFLGLLLRPEERRLLLRREVLLATVFFFLAGFQLYLFTFLRELSHRIDQVDAHGLREHLEIASGMLDRTTGGHFKQQMFGGEGPAARPWAFRLNYLFTLLMNYPSVAFLLGGLGLWDYWKRRSARSSFAFFGLALGVQVLWSSNYFVWDAFAFGLPVWAMFAVLVTCGADNLMRRAGLPRRVLLGLAPTLLAGPLLYAAIPHWAQSPGFWQRYFSTFRDVSNLWDPATFFGNPNKRSYVDAVRIADAFFETVERRANVFDSDTKGYYPLALYYQGALGRRPDIEFHGVLSASLNEAKVRGHAIHMRRLLAEGRTVYVASTGWPERAVLNQLYELLAAEEPRHRPRSARDLNSTELEDAFPRHRLERIPLSADGRRFIYRFVPREPGS
jgi:hypothetical protein